MSYTAKSVIIICVVGVVSFFIAQAVIPEKGAVTMVAEGPASAPAHSPPMVQAVISGEEIPVVVIGDNPPARPVAAGPVASAPVAAAVPISLEVAVVTEPEYASFTAAAYEPTAAGVRSVPARTMAAQMAALSATPASTPSAKAEPAKTAPPALPDARPAANTFTPPPTPTPTPAPPPPDTAQRRRTESNIRVERAAVCSAIEDKSPKGIADRFPKNSPYICYFTHISGARDSTAAVIHRWYHEGKLIQTAVLGVRSSSWRTHSKRNMSTVEEPSGNWRVEVLDRQTGKLLESAAFIIE